MTKMKKSQILKKNDYNSIIKSFQNFSCILVTMEKSIESVERKLAQLKTQRSIIYYNVSDEFVFSMKKEISHIPKEIIDMIVNYFGFRISRSNTLMVLFRLL